MFTENVLDICRSLFNHSFERILIPNGHGRNICSLEVVARRVILHNLNALCAFVRRRSLQAVSDVAKELRESKFSGDNNLESMLGE